MNRQQELPAPVVVELKEPKRAILPLPQSANLQKVEWKVLTPETARELLKDPRAVYFGLTPQGYEAQARNVAELIRWAKEASWQLEYYRKDADHE